MSCQCLPHSRGLWSQENEEKENIERKIEKERNLIPEPLVLYHDSLSSLSR